MALIRVPIGAEGPVIDLGIWLARALAHALVAQGQAVPPPQTIRALIDTGADRTAIHPNALASIASPPSGTTTFIMDGSSCSMPDTPELQRHFGQPGNQRPGCGFPVAHLLVLFHAGTGFCARS